MFGNVRSREERPGFLVMATRVRNHIRRHRFEHGEMTQKELAAAVGLTRQTIVAIERQKYSPSLEAAFKIANVFSLPLESVFEYVPDPDDQQEQGVG